MKQILHLILISLAVSAALPTYPSDKVAVGGVVMDCDTVSHNVIGPGTTFTQLHLYGEQPLDVYYFTIDLSHPGVTLRAATGATENRLEKTSSMAKRLSEPGGVCFAGINGDGFDVVSTYPDGSMRPRLASFTSIIDNTIRKTSAGGFQFILEDNNIPNIGHINFSKGIVTSGDRKTMLGGINIFNVNYNGDVLPDNAVTVYNADGWRTTAQGQWAGNCAEVTASYQDISGIHIGKTTLLKVTSQPTSTGDASVPKDGVVLIGRGTGRDFIESLAVGDEVMIENNLILENGTPVLPKLAMGENPMVVEEGKALDSDGKRYDAVFLHPRTGIGYTHDRKKVIMMVIDGRGVSAGATTRQLGDLFVYAGAYEAVNFDGGGSSTAYTRHAGVVNRCSDTSGERTVGASIFAVAMGDTESSEVSAIRFADYKLVLPAGSIYSPTVYAYNEAGLPIDTDFKNHLLSADASLGEIDADGTTIAFGNGKGGWLKAFYNGYETKVAVELLPSEIALRHTSVLIDRNHPYSIELTATAGGKVMPASPVGFIWKTDNPAVATVDEYGMVRGVANGIATITGENKSGSVTLNVIVEIPDGKEIPFSTDIEEWKVSATAIKITSTEASRNGISIAFTMGSSIAKARMTLNNRKTLYSRPESLLIGYAATAVPKEMTVVILPANHTAGVKLEKKMFVQKSGEWEIPLKDVVDTSDPAVWPIEVMSISVVPGDAAKASGSITLSPVNMVYGDHSGVTEISYDGDNPDCDEQWYSVNGIRVSAGSLVPGLYIRRVKGKATKVIVK